MSSLEEEDKERVEKLLEIPFNNVCEKTVLYPRLLESVTVAQFDNRPTTYLKFPPGLEKEWVETWQHLLTLEKQIKMEISLQTENLRLNKIKELKEYLDQEEEFIKVLKDDSRL